MANLIEHILWVASLDDIHRKLLLLCYKYLHLALKTRHLCDVGLKFSKLLSLVAKGHLPSALKVVEVCRKCSLERCNILLLSTVGSTTLTCLVHNGLV